MSKVRIIFTRHAERLPSGELSPEGLKNAEAKGRALGKQAQVLLSYASDHPSKRAFDTAEIIANASKIALAPAGSESFTKEVKDFYYDVFSPDLMHILAKTKGMIDAATLKEIGLSTDRDKNGELKIKLEELPKDQQQEIAKIRQKNQSLGFDYWLEQPGVVQRLAMCLAHRLVTEINDSQKYNKYKSVIFNNVGHGCFGEALFEKAGMDNSNGPVSLTNGQNGGYLQPLESFYFDIDSQKEIPKLLPLSIERDDDSVQMGLFLSYKQLLKLDKDYKIWKKSLK